MTNEDFSIQRWIELHRHFSHNWHFRSERPWETIKENILVSSALTSLAIYSIIYLYTSEFFWEPTNLTAFDRFLVRLGVIAIPVFMFIINWIFWQNFRFQCKSMYRVYTIVDKIETKLGLYEERKHRENYRGDRWYVPDSWRSRIYCSSKQFVDDCMRRKDSCYQRMLKTFRVFAGLAILIGILEIVLLVNHL